MNPKWPERVGAIRTYAEPPRFAVSRHGDRFCQFDRLPQRCRSPVARCMRRQRAGTVIATAKAAFGTMLVVGSGKYAGYTLYYFTGDESNLFPCTATIVKSLPGGPGSCTGPSSAKTAEWPAITTVGQPVAGSGVNQKLLGTVDRKGIGNQVTYAGHPLSLFDQGPGQITGQGWDEPSLPPWHGVWWLLAPSGVPLPLAGDVDDDDGGRARAFSRHDDAHRHRLGDLPGLLLQRRQLGDELVHRHVRGGMAATRPPKVHRRS